MGKEGKRGGDVCVPCGRYTVHALCVHAMCVCLCVCQTAAYPLQEFVLKLAKPVQVTQIVVMCINGEGAHEGGTGLRGGGAHAQWTP